MFCYILGEAEVAEFFIQDLHLNCHFFSFHYCYIHSQLYLDYLSLTLKVLAYQTSFRKDLDKSVLSVPT